MNCPKCNELGHFTNQTPFSKWYYCSNCDSTFREARFKMYSEMLIKQTAEMTDHELMETARRIHGEIYKRMAAKAAEIQRNENKDTAIKNLYNTIDELRAQLAAKVEKKMTKKEAVKLFEQFLESVR